VVSSVGRQCFQNVGRALVHILLKHSHVGGRRNRVAAFAKRRDAGRPLVNEDMVREAARLTKHRESRGLVNLIRPLECGTSAA
jgi:hypothetical protein